MTELLTAAQMRAIEQAAIDSGTVTGLELMERAGVGVVEAIYEEWPAFAEVEAMRGASPSSSIGRSDQWRNNGRSPEYVEQDEKPLRAVVLCGPGNNGGDGFVVARLLQEKGWLVHVLLLGKPEELPHDAKLNYDIWIGGGTVEPLTERALREIPYRLYIDALFGTGLSRQLEGHAKDVITHLGGRNGDSFQDSLVCIDSPSGICAHSGKVIGNLGWSFGPLSINFARLTVTFGKPKQGHFLADGPRLCGKLVIKDIGVGSGDYRTIGNQIVGGRLVRLPGLKPHEVTRLTCKKNLTLWGKEVGKHKFSHGHALILSGGPGHTGAARLAARGALRIGAGVVTLGVPPAAQQEAASQVTAIMLKRVGDAVAFEKVLEDQRITALCLGPALGLGEEKAALIRTALKSRRNCVLDADALTILSQDETLFAQLHSGCVLTPHAGEFARLFPDISEKLAAPATRGPAYSKVDATRDASARAGCVV